MATKEDLKDDVVRSLMPTIENEYDSACDDGFMGTLDQYIKYKESLEKDSSTIEIKLLAGRHDDDVYF